MVWSLLLLAFLCLAPPQMRGEEASCCSLFSDLALVEQIDRDLGRKLPFFYNSQFVGGYFTMPSARFPQVGDLAVGVAAASPYTIFGANFTPFSRIELAANYRVLRGIEESNFGKRGFGDDADRVGNVKFGLLVPEDGVPFFPSIAFGLDDVIGTKRFSSQYFVATKEWKDFGFELSLGWGWGRIKGVFGGAAWTPFFDTDIPLLSNLSLIVEYDANNYKNHKGEHGGGRSVSSRWNGGISYLLGNCLQLSLHSVRGEKIGGSGSIRFPLGTTEGLFPKVDNPCPYVSPMDTEPLGPLRPEKEFACELACRLAEQGLDLNEAYLSSSTDCGKTLFLQVVDNIYRRESDVRDRIEGLLGALTPSNISNVKVVIEAEGIKSHSYCFRRADLFDFQTCTIDSYLLHTLSPMEEAGVIPGIYDAALLFQRQREFWTFTFRPQLINFFGATTGKYKYSLGLLASLEGFLPGGLTYKAEGVYSVYSSMHGLTSRDFLNPSELLHVRSDSMKYFQAGRVRLEEFFLQKAANLGQGWFLRGAGGYFEPAFGGGALEVLYYPAGGCFAIGADAAVVWKREYNGLGFFRTVPRFTSNGAEVFEKYTGLQYFLNLHYDFRPLSLLFEIKAGQFLAKDLGARFLCTRVFPSGSRFSLWVTLTNGHDKVNGHTYFDKGFAFTIPFDIFLKKSSRTFLNYAMSAWLRDVGAISATGIPLYDTLYEERYD